MAFLSVLKTAIELGLIVSLCVLALYLSYSNLNVCDLSTDGCFTLGAAVGCVVAISGHPYLAILAAIGSGMLSGLVVSFLQTKMHINSLLAGIVVNTGLYTINIAVMGQKSVLNLNNVETVFTKMKEWTSSSFFSDGYKIVVGFIFVVLAIAFLSYLLRTRFGLALRATGDNLEMVTSSSISPDVITIIGLCLSGGLCALSGSLMAFYQKSVSIDIGNGMVTIALASLLLGGLFFKKRGGVTTKAIFAVVGAILFRLVYTLALQVNIPAFYLKLISSIIVVIILSFDYLKERGGLAIKKLKTGLKKEKN